MATSADTTGGDVYQDVYNGVDTNHLDALLRDMTGVNPVTVAGQTFSITNRYAADAKTNYRKYWTSYFESLGMTVTPQAFAVNSGIETQGHNLEAILPGKVADSVVIIVHYDSTGPHGADNAGVDDDMTGMSIMMETARILNAYRGRVHNTVRFVAADYEEWGGLAGARAYAKYVQQLASQQHFKLVASIDDEQSGWKEGTNAFVMFDRACNGHSPDSSSLSALLGDTATKYSHIAAHNSGCMGPNSDMYAMWEVGSPAVVFSEYDPFNNPHFDQEGGDTYDRITKDYFFQIAEVGVTFGARVVGIDPT
jgi:Zn-dependent M28 family amino/carboxypeptidase